MKKRNKQYRPKPVLPMLMFAYDAAHATQLKMMPHTAFDRVSEGVANGDDIATIVVRLDWGYILAKTLFDEPVISNILETAFEAVKTLREAINTHGSCLATQNELQAIGIGLNTVDDLQDNSTRREQWNALNKLNDLCGRLSSARATAIS